MSTNVDRPKMLIWTNQVKSIRRWSIKTSIKFIRYANLCIQFRDSTDYKKTAGRVANGYVYGYGCINLYSV